MSLKAWWSGVWGERRDLASIFLTCTPTCLLARPTRPRLNPWAYRALLGIKDVIHLSILLLVLLCSCDSLRLLGGFFSAHLVGWIMTRSYSTLLLFFNACVVGIWGVGKRIHFFFLAKRCARSKNRNHMARFADATISGLISWSKCLSNV